MTVHHFTPYAVDKDLGKAYNLAISMIGEDEVACIRDGDTMFLTPDFGDIVFNYAYQNPGCVMTCYTNRIHELAKEQLLPPTKGSDLIQMLANTWQDADMYKTTPLTGPLSGFLMLVPKSIWNKVKFREGIGLLGVDTWFYKDLREAGVPILRMDGLYVWHTYRLGKDIKNTDHLR